MFSISNILCAVVTPQGKPVSSIAKIAAVAAFSVFLMATADGSKAASSDTQANDAPSCKTDWKKCTDNEDLVNNYKEWAWIQAKCKSAAIESAKYGDPEFSWLSYFGHFDSGDDYIKTGIAKAYEKDAKFQNAFGAMVRSTVDCTYDLNKQRVISTTVRPK